MRHHLIGLALAVALAAGCGADPGVDAGPDPEAEQVALVRAEQMVLATPETVGGFDRLVVQGQVSPLIDTATDRGRAPRRWVASFVADGQWRLVFKAESGVCVVDCAVQRYWYFTVSPHGQPRLEGRHAVVAGTAGSRAVGEPRWGFPGDEERRLVATARAAQGR
jgi:hypothetical protein